MNQGWKGNLVGIDRCTIGQEGGKTVMTAGVQFMAEDGTVHAVCTHSFLLDPEVQSDEVTTAAVALLQALRKKIEALHFTQPQSNENPVLKGIAESLVPDGPPRGYDEPGPQG